MVQNGGYMSQLAPAAVFAYRRADKIQSCLEALEKNLGADKTAVFLYADGAKDENDRPEVERTREFISRYAGRHKFADFTVCFRERNMGLADSIITGVTEIMERYGRAIVVEDDLITSADFLSYMNGALSYYEKKKEIGEISAFTHPLKGLKSYEHDVYMTRKAECWGWATWKDRWELADWEMRSYAAFKRSRQDREFEKLQKGINNMLKQQMEGKLDSWAVRWCYSLFVNDRLTVYPKVSRTRNIGFDGSGVHCGRTDRYDGEISTDIGGCRFELLDVDRRLEKEAAEFEYVSLFQKGVNYIKRLSQKR